jgi:hypothetical protein
VFFVEVKKRKKLEHRKKWFNKPFSLQSITGFSFFFCFLFTSHVMCGWLLRRSILAPNPLLGTLEYIGHQAQTLPIGFYKRKSARIKFKGIIELFLKKGQLAVKIRKNIL